jgi:hypothetical protein
LFIQESRKNEKAEKERKKGEKAEKERKKGEKAEEVATLVYIYLFLLL